MFTIDLILEFNGSQFHLENVNLLKSGLFFRPTHSRWQILENNVINIFLKAKAKKLPALSPQSSDSKHLLRDKMEQLQPSVQSLRGSSVNVGDCSNPTSSWLVISWLVKMEASYWSAFFDISHTVIAQ